MDEAILRELLDLPNEIVTDRLCIRQYRQGDGAALFEAVDESREHILPWMPWGPAHTCSEDSEMQIRRMRSNWDLREDFGCGIFDRKSGMYLGGTGLHRIDWRLRSFEIGYWIRRTAEGNGYVTESARALTDFAFDRMAANRVFVRIAAENERSVAVPKRLGFQFEGTLRSGIVDANGRVGDLLMFATIPDEWRVLRASR